MMPSLKYFLYMVESPRFDDLYNDKSDTPLLRQALHLQKTSFVARVVPNRDLLAKALDDGLVEAIREERAFPIIYISAHGSDQGIYLTDGALVRWKDLHDLLIPISTTVENAGAMLVLCMSSCEGLNAQRMAMKENGPHPFSIVLGNRGKPDWADTTIAFAAFFHVLRKTDDLGRATEAMRAASADDGWQIVTAEQARAAFLRMLHDQKLRGIVQRIVDSAREREST